MAWWMTNYPPFAGIPAANDDKQDSLIGDYSSYVWATSRQKAEANCRLRNIGEKVTFKTSHRECPYVAPSVLMMKRRLSPKDRLNIIHGTCFLSYLAMKALEFPPAGIVGDEGLLHQVIHSMSQGFPRKDMALYLRSVEKRVPGYTNRNGGL